MVSRRLNRRESKPRRSDQFGIVRNSKIYPPDFRIQPIIADKEHSFYVLDALLRSWTYSKYFGLDIPSQTVALARKTQASATDKSQNSFQIDAYSISPSTDQTMVRNLSANQKGDLNLLSVKFWFLRTIIGPVTKFSEKCRFWKDIPKVINYETFKMSSRIYRFIE